MALVLLLVMLTACAAVPQDLSGKMFTFPEVTNTAHVKLTTSTQNLGAVTVCLRFFTDLKEYPLFSLATPSVDNDFLIYGKHSSRFHLWARNKYTEITEMKCTHNEWHSICATWESTSGIGQLWLDGKPSSRRYITSGANISGPIVMILGQEQDTHGGGFDIKQCFVGMMTDVHMWNHILSPCEIQNYVDVLNFTPGNVLNWRALEFSKIGRVLIEDRQKTCQ